MPRMDSAAETGSLACFLLGDSRRVEKSAPGSWEGLPAERDTRTVRNKGL